MAGGEEFKVSYRKHEVVRATLPLQEHWLPLSNLDLLLPPVDVGVFFIYKNNDDDGRSQPSVGAAAVRAGVLKKALAQALVIYYAFSGEVVTNSFGEPEILCNNRGVDFSEAFADVELKELNLYNPDESVEGKLVPNKKHGVLAVQATELKCGGTVVACTFDHRIADAYSTNMFIVSWAHIANSKSPPSTIPSFRRSLLNPRRPARFHPSLNDVYIPVTSLPPPPPPPKIDDTKTHLASRIYYVEADKLTNLQALSTTNNGHKRSKLESFCAFLWKMVADSVTTTTTNDDHLKKVCKMGIVVDGRSRLADENKMASYFGNVLSIPFGGIEIQKLNETPLNLVADEVCKFLESAITKEHFLGLIDWVEAHRPVPGLAKIYATGSEEGPAFVVSSGQRFPVSEVDFGWGKPVFGSYHFPWRGSSGYVMPMPTAAGNGDWIVYMHMYKAHLDVIEKKAGHLFKPLDFDYLMMMN